MKRRRTNGAPPAPEPTEMRAQPIAIIGMAGRFPGASNVEHLWTNLAHGVESIAILTQDEMRAAGIPETISKLPGYVNAAPVLDEVEKFDAHFFGFSARDAALTDPQHRIFLETAWQALEDAGYDPARYPGSIGVFGGCELSSYLGHLYQNLESLKYIDGMQLMVTNDKDHLCTQVSYRLNLRGPSVVVQTTCSTSLVAVGLACESLQHGRCDMALAGGVTVKVPQRGGYFYTAGSILSPDGHCRPFDAQAQGTIVGSGVGLVLLKPLAKALQAGDNIRAVILGVGLNNDGNDKVGYTAPSPRGQAAAIRAAHKSAGINADSIGYVEAHGTGTILGDPIEFSALTEVFRETTTRRGFCGIGSAKSNFGHLSCAAGVTGLIKTVLALENQAMPPTVHYTSPNPALDLASSPFYVTTRLQRWDRNGIPRRAGISSFGVGGTNAHVVLEEAPARVERKAKRTHQVFTISARSEAALREVAKQLSAHLRSHPEIDLADAAFTLHQGRHFFKHRYSIVVGAKERARLADSLESAEKLHVATAASDIPTMYLFPGQGSQYPGMAAGLYRSEPTVRKAIDRCARLLKPLLEADLKKVLFPSRKDRTAAAEALRNTRWAQPALFTVGYALSELYTSWGIKPAAMIGHSVGEYVAATRAGVMTLEEALTIIAKRGQLISALPRGSMLAVMAPAEKLERFVDANISIAAVNAPGFTVLSGPDAAIQHLEKVLGDERLSARRLHTSHAFHSSMMDPILLEFEEIVSRIQLATPVMPFISTLTGKWAGTEVTKPDYWSRQLRQAVRFADGMYTLMSSGDFAGKRPICIEAGPGNTLSTFVRELTKEKPATCLQSLPGPEGQSSDMEEVLAALGQLWSNGVEINWDAFHSVEQRSRVSLPTYPFERQTYWIGTSTRVEETRDPYNWFYRPGWKEQPLASKLAELAGRRILILDHETSPGRALAEILRTFNCDVIMARPGEQFICLNEREYVLNPEHEADFGRLAQAVCSGDSRLAGVVDCWCATALPPAEVTGTPIDKAAVMALLAPLRLTQSLSNQQTLRPLPVLLVASGTTRIASADILDPSRALGTGVARVLPQEYAGVRISHVDVDSNGKVAAMIAAELATGASQAAVAFRNGKRYIEEYDPVTIRAVKPIVELPPNPVVLITGGLGHMGINLAEALFRKAHARLVLFARTSLPEPAEWAIKSEDSQTPPQQKQLLQRLAKMRAERDELIVVAADMNDAAQVRSGVETALARFGQIDMVIHGAARIDPAAFGPAANTDWNIVEAQFSPKLRGLFHLIDAFGGREPHRWILHSSISSVLGGLGLAAYAGVNAMLDALALQHGPHWLSIDWDAWDNAAEAQSSSMPTAIKPAEGQEVLLRLLGGWQGSRVLVAINLAERLKAWVQHTEMKPAENSGMERHPRPNLTTSFIAPRTETELLLTEIWGSHLGLDGIGIQDRFFDLGGHSLLASQIASEICDRFQIDLPVLKLFQAPTISELAVLVERARAGDINPASAPDSIAPALAETELQGNAPEIAAKSSYREFYNDITRRLGQSGMGAASFFLNYGYISLDQGDEARFQVPVEVFNRNSVRLVFELIGKTQLENRKVLDVGCGRGGAAALMAEMFGAIVTGVDLSPEAISFCRSTHRNGARFEVGDAEHLPFADGEFEAVTNIESSHTYPNLRAFFTEVRRMLATGGMFLYTDLLPVQRWAEVRVLLESLGLRAQSERNITANVLASCDGVAASRTQAFGGSSEMIDNFLAVPGSAVYEQMNSGAWEYRILRAVRK